MFTRMRRPSGRPRMWESLVHQTPSVGVAFKRASSTASAAVTIAGNVLKYYRLTLAFRQRGHLVANTDPLQESMNLLPPKLRGHFVRKRSSPFLQRMVVNNPYYNREIIRLVEVIKKSRKDADGKNTVELDLSAWGLSNRTPYTEQIPEGVMTELLDIGDVGVSVPSTAGEFIDFLTRCYCGSVGLEYTHITDRKEHKWLQHRLEHSHLLWSESEPQRPPKYRTLGEFINVDRELESSKKRKKETKDSRKGASLTRNGQSFFGSDLDPQSQKLIWEQLLRADYLETFLCGKHPNAKTFGLAGAESLIPGLSALFGRASELGVNHVEMGMTHRGRLNVLVNIIGKPIGAVLREFKDVEPGAEDDYLRLGDVKYHLGTQSECTFARTDGKESQPVQIGILPNPSHLEQVTPVVVGKVRAKQYYLKDWERRKALGVVLHGDAAFAGQGIVAETLALSQLPAFYTGGTIHIVVNNNIGFTTESSDSHSSVYPTDVAKATGAPIFHVNSDDPEAVVRVMKLAIEYRHRFRKDVIIDYICFRRFGHSEAEDPRITQPVRQRVIDEHPSTLEMFEKRLIDSGVLSEELVESKRRDLVQEYEAEYDIANTEGEVTYDSTSLEWLASSWQGVALSAGLGEVQKPGRAHNMTGADKDLLQLVGKAICGENRENLKLHPDVCKIVEKRKKALATGEGIDFALAESLAFGVTALPVKEEDRSGNPMFGKRDVSRTEHVSSGKGGSVLERSWSRVGAAGSLRSEFLPPVVEHPTVHVRLSGQDCERGTFNQRHALLVCQETNERYWPLNNILGPGEQEEVHICNSNLSEAAVLGFEYGYSLENDNALVVWEAQFGDFVNVAQPMIDNFIVSGEHKWSVQSSLVMLLPHGLEGAGPEHSSARPERFLQLVDDDPNIDLSVLTPKMRDDLERGFDAIDIDNSGYISIDNLRDTLGKTIDPDALGERWDIIIAELNAVHAQATRRSDKVVSKEQYMKFALSWLHRNTESMANFAVCAPTTPANYFHCLRRQIHRPFSKPLVVLSPKQLHHHKPCTSSMDEIVHGTWFRRVISETSRANNLQQSKRYRHELLPDEDIRRLVIVSGKFYYDLYHARRKRKIHDVAIVRLEQIAPFPHDHVAAVCRKYQNAEIVFVQEEPENQGYWSYVSPRLDTCLRVYNNEHPGNRVIRSISRQGASTPAHGSFRVHLQETKDLVEEVFSA
eukprot:g1158.t1